MDREPPATPVPVFRSQMARMYLYLGQHKEGIEVISPLPLSQAGTLGMLLYAETGQMAKAVEIARGHPSRPPYGFAAYMRGYARSSRRNSIGIRLARPVFTPSWAWPNSTRLWPCWDAKFAYWAIRPNQLDPAITTLFRTPNHPSYPAAHACDSAAIASTLGYLFPRDAQLMQRKRRNPASPDSGRASIFAAI